MNATEEKLTIRRATRADAQTLADIEAACFPPAEAASLERIAARLDVFADHFLVLERDGKAVGFIDGMVTEDPYIEDVMFEKADMHRPEGPWQSIFGLNVLPAYRRRGYAGRLIRALVEQARQEGRRGVTLTCKEALLHYYASFGFVPLGLSESQHGGARWYDMVLEFKPEIAVHTPVKAVFFDLDGTLIDSVPTLTEAVNRVMRREGLHDFTEAEVTVMIGKGARVLIERVCAAQGLEATPENVERLMGAYAEAMMSEGLPSERFFPGAREAVAALHAAGIKTVLVTNKMRVLTEYFLKNTGLGADLDALVAADDTPHPKPAPDMLLLACRKTGVTPEEAVMVGDSENDALAARAAGTRAMLVNCGYNGTVPMVRWAKENGFPLVFDDVAGVRDYIFACQGLFVK